MFSDKLIFFFLFCYALLFPVCFFPYAEEISRVPQEVLLHVFGALILISIGFRFLEARISSGGWTLQVPKGIGIYLALILGFNLLLLPSIFFSGEPMFSLGLYRNVLFGSAVAAGALMTLNSPFRILWLVRLLIFGGAVNGLYGLLQSFGVDYVFAPREGIWTFGGRVLVTGFTDNPNVLGGYLAGLVPLSVILFFYVRGIPKKTWFAGLAGVLAAPILITNTVGAFASFCLSLAVFGLCHLIFEKGDPGFRKIKIGGLVLFFLLGMSIIGYTFKERIQKENWPPISARQRLIQWSVGWEMVKRNPVFGAGFGAYQADFLDHKMQVYYRHPGDLNYEIPSQTHNDLLQLWAEGGIFPVGIVLLLLGGVVLEYFRFMRNADGRFSIGPYSARGLLSGCVFGMLAVLANSLVHFPFHVVQSALVAILLASLSVCILHVDARAAEPGSGPKAHW